jgi:lipid A 4'-phosphatase
MRLWQWTRHHGSWYAMLLGCIALVGLCSVPQIDLALSARFYHPALPQAWYLEAAQPWRWLYRYGEYPALAMACGALLVCLGSCLRRSWCGYRRHCLFLILAVALGPGLLVNGLLKPAWGRPRPRQIEQFGGSQAFRPWWQPGGPGAGESFPSGHAAMGYILVAVALLVPRQRSIWLYGLALTSALGFGTLLGITRLVQGGHFASDIVWAGCLMCGTAIVLRKALTVLLLPFPRARRGLPSRP